MNKIKKLLPIFVSFLFVLGLSFAITSCSDDNGVKSIKNLSYNGETITWSSVKNAKNYKISINNGTESIVSQTDNKVTYRYDSNGEDFDFSIEAVIKEDSDKNPTYTIRFENIGQVTNLEVKNGALTWQALENAEKYEVMYNGNIVSSDVGTTSYTMQEGEFSYKVRALKGLAESQDGNIPYYSIWSESITGTVLSSPNNLTYDSEIFTWEKVNGASSYIIKIGNEEFTSKTNKYEYIAGKEDFSVSVCAVGNTADKIYDSQYSEPKQYSYIAPIEGLNVVDGILKWTASENAIRYKIKINGIVNNEELTSNEYSALSSGNSYRIQVLPIGKSDFYFSHWSNEITINILRSPVVSYSDGVIRWNQVTGCAGYELKITKDDNVIHTTSVGEETFIYDYAFEEAGDYLVYVKATSLGTGGIYESKYSSAYSIKRLATPSNQQVINRPLEQNQVAVTFNPSIGASGYSLLADDVEIATITSGSTFSVDLSKMTSKNEEAVVNFKIIARGQISSNGAILDSKVPLEFDVKKLATCQNLSINGNQLSWDSVSNTSKYILTIDGKRTEVTTTSFTLTDLSAGTHSIYVQAMGNGHEVITGSFSNVLDIKKLATPSNLMIKNGLLTWSTIADASAYKVILGTETYNADTTSFNLLGYESSIMEGKGTQISVYAIGNGSNIINSDVSATKTISKYNRPSIVKVNGDNLVWNPSSVDSINCNSYKLIISKDGNTEYTVILTGSSYSMNNFESGTYTVKVIALGDYVSTINSPESNAFSFTKLAAIKKVNKSGNTYTWDAIAGASSYEIKLSKDATWTSINTNSFTCNFTAEGEFEVSIRAIGNGIDVINSNTYSFAQRVSRLTQPVRQDSLTNNNAFKVEVTGNTFTVTIKKQDGATGYKLFVGGIEKTSIDSETNTEIIYTYTMTTTGATYFIQVQILGNQFDENGNFLIDSNKSIEESIIYNPNA